MEFYTSFSHKRPVRLCEKTRQFAYESLNHKYGLDTLKTPYVSLDHINNYNSLSDLEKYNTAIREIVTKCPIRICDGELLSGSATLGDAIKHIIPASFNNQSNQSVSHLTVDFFEVLNIGLNGIRRKTEKSLKVHTEPDKKEFLKSCIFCIDCIKIWHKRYIDALTEKGNYEKNIKNLSRVPFEPAQSFYEAVQSIWFCFAFLRLTGNWPGIGRIDVLLGKYLKHDLENNIITLDDAREILAHFFIKGCEWITGESTTSGDAQHYQNIVLAGVDEQGCDITNEVTYLVLDIIEETGISDFPTTVRINKNTDEALLKRVAEVIRYGGGTVAIYNEDLILEALCDIGYPLSEARTFANDGCWEVQIPGKTRFAYIPFDSLKILQSITLDNYSGKISFSNFNDLLNHYKKDLEKLIDTIYSDTVEAVFESDNKTFKKGAVCTAVALFEHPCIEKGLSYYDGGTEYTVISPHIGGLPDAVNSLYAIKKAVFDDKIISFDEFMQVLKNNWDGNEDLRTILLNKYMYYGNDNDEVDEIASNILNDFSDMCTKYNGKTPMRFISGVSTFGRQINWAPSRIATPFGRKKGEILSGNLSPTPGTDQNGALAIIKSYCKADLKKQHSGAALDIGLIPSDLETENSLSVLMGIIKSFVLLGGFFMQIDTADKNLLIEAQKHPENYQNLSVRISGWNARFVTMNKEWQDMIIQRAKGM